MNTTKFNTAEVGIESNHRAAVRNTITAKHGVILVADDQAPLREFIATTLRAHGYEAIVAADGLEALELWANAFEDTRLIVTDINMPCVNGPDLVSRIWSIFPHLPVIYISGDDNHAAAREHVRTRRAQFILKPFGAGEFLAAVAAVF